MMHRAMMVLAVDDDNIDDVAGWVNKTVMLTFNDEAHQATVRDVRIGVRVTEEGEVIRKAFCMAVYYTFDEWQPPVP